MSLSFSQISFHHLWIFNHCQWIAFGDLFTMIQDDEPLDYLKSMMLAVTLSIVGNIHNPATSAFDVLVPDSP